MKCFVTLIFSNSNCSEYFAGFPPYTAFPFPFAEHNVIVLYLQIKRGNTTAETYNLSHYDFLCKDEFKYGKDSI